MLNNRKNTDCGFEDLIVAYIYDEVATADRRKFEMHLVNCTPCTDEFAEISNARFSVFEWQKEEFAHLSTPEIVIPGEQRQIVAEESAQVGFLAGLRSIFGGAGVPVMVAAVLLICLGIGFAALSLIGRGDEHIASNIKKDDDKPASIVAKEDRPAVTETRETVAAAPEVESSFERPVESDARPVRSVENRRSKPVRSVNPQTTARQSVNERIPVTDSKPVLSNYKEMVDKSLRLTDLFDDDIGSSR